MVQSGIAGTVYIKRYCRQKQNGFGRQVQTYQKCTRRHRARTNHEEQVKFAWKWSLTNFERFLTNCCSQEQQKQLSWRAIATRRKNMYKLVNIFTTTQNKERTVIVECQGPDAVAWQSLRDSWSNVEVRDSWNRLQHKIQEPKQTQTCTKWPKINYCN